MHNERRQLYVRQFYYIAIPSPLKYTSTNRKTALGYVKVGSPLTNKTCHPQHCRREIALLSVEICNRDCGVRLLAIVEESDGQVAATVQIRHPHRAGVVNLWSHIQGTPQDPQGTHAHVS